MNFSRSKVCPGIHGFYQAKGVNLTSRYIFFNVLPVLVCSFLCSITTVQAADPPDSKACDQSDVYERLACRQEGIADQMNHLAGDAFGPDSQLSKYAKPSSLERIENAKHNANFAKEQNTAKAFKKLAKAGVQGNREAGHLVPFGDEDDDLSGYSNDGICDYEQGDNTANCAAIELDEFGELQLCNPEKKNKGKGKDGNNLKFSGLECDRWYESEDGSTSDEESDMLDLAEQLDDSYRATEDDMRYIGVHLEAVNETLPDPDQAGLLLYAENEENSCEIPELNEALVIAVSVARGVHAGLAGGAGIASAWTGQTVVTFGFGGNANAAQMPFEIAALIANLTYITLDEINQAQNAELQDAIMACVNQASGNIDLLLTEVFSLQQRLEETTGELTRLLHTPEGMRSSERPVCNELPCSYPFIPGNWPEPPGSE
jgi:hypothetical protein